MYIIYITLIAHIYLLVKLAYESTTFKEIYFKSESKLENLRYKFLFRNYILLDIYVI